MTNKAEAEVKFTPTPRDQRMTHISYFIEDLRESWMEIAQQDGAMPFKRLSDFTKDDITLAPGQDYPVRFLSLYPDQDNFRGYRGFAQEPCRPWGGWYSTGFLRTVDLPRDMLMPFCGTWEEACAQASKWEEVDNKTDRSFNHGVSAPAGSFVRAGFIDLPPELMQSYWLIVQRDAHFVTLCGPKHLMPRRYPAEILKQCRRLT